MPEKRDNSAGLLFIGDPHVAHRPPGFRKDDFTATVLASCASRSTTRATTA